MNSRKDNLEFKIQFSTTNLRYLLSCDPIDQRLVDFNREEIRKAELELGELNETQHT